MPTRDQMNQEINMLGRLHKRDMYIIDGQNVVIEIISADSYDIRLYDNRLALAGQFTEAVVLQKINKLIKSLVISEK